MRVLIEKIKLMSLKLFLVKIRMIKKEGQQGDNSSEVKQFAANFL